MIVIAWDGKTLAADKRSCSAGSKNRKVTKIFRLDIGLAAVSGELSVGFDILNWLKAGADKEKFPKNKNVSDLLFISNEKKIFYYEDAAPVLFENRFYAIGSGRDYALAAMHLGKTAIEAVEVACIFDQSCGNGIDALQM